MVYHHVQGVIYEVANGEAYKGVAGGRERGDEVVLHLRGLQVQLNSQTGGRNMTHKQWNEESTVLKRNKLLIVASFRSLVVHMENL